jgi:hypothetical protein
VNQRIEQSCGKRAALLFYLVWRLFDGCALIRRKIILFLLVGIYYRTFYNRTEQKI